MSMMFCEKCDGTFDSDFQTDCLHCEEETEDDGSHKDVEEYQRERENDQIESYLYPSEGN